MQSGRYAYQGIHDWCSDNASAALGVPAGPCLDMQIFLCADDTPLQPQQKAAIVVGVVLFTLLLIALLIYASLAKASKLRRSLMLAALRLKVRRVLRCAVLWRWVVSLPRCAALTSAPGAQIHPPSTLPASSRASQSRAA
jgi:hypothetical protein